MRILCAGLLFLSFFTQAQEKPDFMKAFDTTHFGKNAEVGRYLNTRGFRLYYEVYGQGEPLLIIHGNGGSINNFVFQIPYFAKKYKVILADSRAHGNSPDEGDSGALTFAQPVSPNVDMRRVFGKRTGRHTFEYNPLSQENL